MDEDSRKECPLCASRNVSLSPREHGLVCRDCGTVITGTPVPIPRPREEVVEIVHERGMAKKVKKFEEKIKKAKASKKVAKKGKKIKKSAKKISKKVKHKKVKKSLMKRFLRRR